MRLATSFTLACSPSEVGCGALKRRRSREMRKEGEEQRQDEEN